MGTVFASFDHEILDLVAIKTLISEYNDDFKAVQRFQREAQLYSRMAHPNIVGFVETGHEQGNHYIALEYVRGHSLADIIDNERQEVLTFDRVVNIIIDVAKALKQVHSLDILHRDIKPSNIILTQDDTIKLLDFGIALTEDGLDLTGTGMIVGTFVYSSPEQNQGRILDERSDLYALGCVFFEMLTGQRALPGNSMTEVAKFQALPALASPSHFNPNVPQELDNIVNKLLKPRPRDRFQTADELIDALTDLKRKDAGAEGQHYFGDEVIEAWEMAKEAFILGHLDQSIQQATFYLAQKPMDPKAHFLLGKLYAQKKLPFNATESFAQAIELDGNNHDYRVDFALALYRLEMFRQCVEQCELILQDDPQDPIARGLHMLAAYQHREEKERIKVEEAAAAGGGLAPPVFKGASAFAGGATGAAGAALPAAGAGGAPPPGQEGAHERYTPELLGADSLRETIPFAVQPPEMQAPPPKPMEGRQTIPFGASHRRGLEERTKAHANMHMASRAKFLSSVFPGLGHLYCGLFYQSVKRILIGLFLLAIIGGSAFMTKYDGPIVINSYISKIAPALVELSVKFRIEQQINRNQKTLFPGLCVFAVLIFLIHWLRCRRSAYTHILKKSLRGKILHCREDGTIKINLGSLRGVELGMRFTIMKGIAKKEYSVDKTVSRRKSYVPIARAEVIKVRNNTSVATVRMLPGVASEPKEGNPVEPVM